MKLENSVKTIYYNLLSNFYIALNLIFPYYNEEILNLQFKSIECINETIIFQSNSRKRKRFNLFVENLIQKNNDLLEQIKKQEEEDNNINNYEKIDNKDNTDTCQDNIDDTTDDSSDTIPDNHHLDDSSHISYDDKCD
jgi:hypothetical protein